MALSVAEEIEMLELELEMEEPPKAQAAIPESEIDYGFGTGPADPYVKPEEMSTGMVLANTPGQIAGGFNKGIADFVNLPMTASKFLMNTRRSIFDQEPLEGAPDLYDIPGVKEATARTIPEGRSGPADALFTGAEWTSGLPFAMAKGVSKAPDILMGLGAMGGEAIGGDPGEGIGGMLGLGAALKGKDFSAIESITDMAKGAIDKVTPGGMFGPSTRARTGDVAAVDFFEKRMADRDKGLAKLDTAIARGEKGSLADLTQDKGLYDVEKAAQTSYAADDIIKQQRADRQRQIIDEIQEPFGAAKSDTSKVDARSVLKQAKAKLAGGEEAVTRGIQSEADIGLAQTRAAQAAAEEEANVAAKLSDLEELGIAPSQKTAQSSRGMKEGFDTLEATLKEDLVRPAWKEFEGGAPIEITELQKTLAAEIDKLPQEQAIDLVTSYKSTLKHIGNWKGQADPESVQYVLSSIKDSVNTAKSTGNFGVLEKELGGLGRVIEDTLTNPLNRTDFKTAIEASKEMYRKTGANTKAGKARLREDAETFGERMGFAGDDGAATGRIISESGDPEIIKQAEDFLKGKAQKEGLDDKFMTKYDQVLDYFPELKTQMKKVSTSKLGKTKAKEFFDETVKTEGKKGEVLTKARDKELGEVSKRSEKLTGTLDERVLGQYSNNPDKTIDKILKGKNDAVKEGDLKELYRNIKLGGADPGPFKAKVKERMLDIVAPPKGNVRQTKEQSIDSYNKIKDTLVDSGVITQKESDAIATALQKSDTSALMREAGKVKASDAASEAMKLMASGSAATLLGMTNSSNQLAMMAIVRRSILKKLKEAEFSKEALARIDEIIANPESFRDLANKVAETKNMDQAADKFVTRAIGGGQLGQMTTEDKE